MVMTATIPRNSSNQLQPIPPPQKEGSILIVSSREDPASQNIARNLISGYGFLPSSHETLVDASGNVRLTTVDKLGIFVEPKDIVAENCSIIFASKHVSSSGKPALTVHATGNLTKDAEFGGRPEEVSLIDPTIVRRVLRDLKRGVSRAGREIDVTMEATHHGPTSFSNPVCFVEVGSGPKEWNDVALGKIAAEAIMEIATPATGPKPNAVGFGGTHYSSKHTRICMEGDYQIGHIVPRHALERGVSDLVLQDTLRKTAGGCNTALIDWKGLGNPERTRLVTSLEGWGIEVVRC